MIAVLLLANAAAWTVLALAMIMVRARNPQTDTHSIVSSWHTQLVCRKRRSSQQKVSRSENVAPRARGCFPGANSSWDFDRISDLSVSGSAGQRELEPCATGFVRVRPQRATMPFED